MLCRSSTAVTFCNRMASCRRCAVRFSAMKKKAAWPVFAVCAWFLTFAVPVRVGAMDEFLTGADVSTLPVSERQGFHYFDQEEGGTFFDIARRNGWNLLRVRLWVSPEARPESAASSLDNVTLLGQRIKAAGFQFLLDLHYSDTWADPGHQKKPAAWADLDFPRLTQQVHDYTRDVVAHLCAAGARPDIVQVGNEIKNGLLYGSGLNGAGPSPGGGFRESDEGGVGRALTLFAAGAAGVRDGSPPAPPLTMLHLPDGQDTAFIKSYFSRVETTGLTLSPPFQDDFDMIGLSYYPAQPWDRKAGYDAWHLAHLVESMHYLAGALHKPLMIVETGWPQKGEVQLLPGTPEYAFTPAGQAQFYHDLLRAVQEVPQGLGKGVVLWTDNADDRNSVFDPSGHALPAMRVLGRK